MAGKEGFLPEAPHLCALTELRPYFSMFVKARERMGEPSRFVLVTYNRVGEGYLEPRTTKGGLTLDVYQGRLTSDITVEQLSELLAGETDRFSSNSTPQEAAQFFSGIKSELSRQILLLTGPTFFIIYAGEGEKFRLALDLVNQLSFLTGAVGKRDLVKFYLLTCKCDLGEKVRTTAPFYANDRLRYLIYNSGDSCGGFGDLQAIADTVLDAVS